MKCEMCSKEHNGEFSQRFCCEKCRKAYATKNDNKKELKQAKCICCGQDILINKRASSSTCKCNNCKEKKCTITKVKCSDNCIFYKFNLCDKSNNKISQHISMLNKYFGNVIGKTEYETFINVQSIKNKLEADIINGLSGIEICKKHMGSPKHGNTIFKWLHIKTRNLSEAVSNAFLTGRLNNTCIKNQFKTEWHKTWDNNEYFLRSSYETDYANELDNKKIHYEVENLRIKYFDSELKTYKCAIPDFYLPDTNTIVEIKSVYTLNFQNMKDKITAYRNLGYNVKVILEHKDETDMFN